jgi:hypothetical protein
MRVSTDIYDASTGIAEHIGKLSNNRKVVLGLVPGDYTFMVGNIPWLDFMKARPIGRPRRRVPVHPAELPLRAKDSYR